jgi:aryl-alcohol dehydrogenase-like predicted oxidoreductase
MAISRVTRRNFLRATSTTAAGLALGVNGLSLAQAAELSLITKAIPATGERLPVVGVGTNAFGVDDPEALARIREVLQKLPLLGGKVVDTAQAYGNSESVIGGVVESIGNRNELFLATKTATRGNVKMADIMEAFTRLRSEQIDLMQVHNFNETAEVIPMLQELKAQVRVRYIGCSTSRDSQYGDMKTALRSYPLDFIQVDYSIDNRTAAEEILPMAEEKGVAVLANMPFGGRRNAASTFARVGDVALPDWASEIDVSSWAQFFLKYVVSHPAVTAAIPGTTKPHHLEDNLGAAHGRIPDASMRKEMESFWDGI